MRELRLGTQTSGPGHRAPSGGAETPPTATASPEGMCLTTVQCLPPRVTLDQQHGRPLGPTPDLRWDAEICILVNPQGIVVHT